MADLPHEAKVRLVTLLAQFCGPAEAARLVSAEFDVAVERRTAWRYDASKKGFAAGPRYRDLFFAVRERWLNDLATVPIAHRGHRLRTLDRLATRLEKRGDYGGAIKALEQAAKEVSGYFSREPVPPPIATSHSVETALLSPIDARAAVASRLNEMLAGTG